MKINPDFAAAWNNLGNANLMQGSADAAIPAFQRAIELNPVSVSFHNSLSRAFFQQSRIQKAIDEANAALRLDSTDAGAQENLAWILASTQQDAPKAIQLARRANETTGGSNPYVLRTLAAAYAAAGQFSEAITTAGRALELSGSIPALAESLKGDLKSYEAGRRAGESKLGSSDSVNGAGFIKKP